MSKAFNFKYLTENSPSLESMVTKDTIRESYLNSTIASLREMNALITENTKKLYSQILEAESKTEENKMFAEYFGQFKDIFGKFVNNVNGMRDRLIINLDNLMDSNSDLVNDDQYISDFSGAFSYSGWEFKELSNPHFPRMNLREIYQKDFDYLGKVMQDKGISASPTERIKIIAQVCNEFSKHGKDGKYVKKLLKDLVDCDDHESISECLYKAFREKKDFEIDKSSLYTYKENLINIEDYKTAITAMCDNLVSDVQFIAEDIYSYLFRNEDNKLRIKTPTNGIIDRDYRLDTYAMNQVDIFMKSKVSQITKVLNIFAMALSIKIDAIVDYINQSKDILRTVKSNENIDAITTDDDGVVPEEDDTEDSSITNDQENEEPVEPEEDLDDNSDELNNTENPDDIDDSELDNEDDLPKEDPIDPESSSDDNEVNDESFDLEESFFDDSNFFSLLIESEILGDEYEDTVEEKCSSKKEESYIDNEDEHFEEADLFEASIHDIELMYEQYEMDQYIQESVLKEADEAKPPVWIALIRKLKELWEKFKDIVIVRSKSKIEYLKKNEKYINTKIKYDKQISMRYSPKFDKLKGIKVEPYNPSLDSKLSSEEAYIDSIKGSCLANITIDKDQSLSNALQAEILGKEVVVENGDITKLPVTIKEAYDFCVNTYTKSVDELKKQTNELNKAQDKAIIAAKSQPKSESAIEDYFIEEDTSSDTSSENNSSNNSSDNKEVTAKDKFNVYFKVSSKIIAAQMTIYQKIFNEMYGFCKWYIKQAGGSDESGDNKKEESTSNTSQNIEKEEL